jgi:hypothetical protein
MNLEELEDKIGDQHKLRISLPTSYDRPMSHLAIEELLYKWIGEITLLPITSDK